MPEQFLPLPEDDDALILRENTRQYGLPAPATFQKWASLPTEAPCEIPYTLVGRKAAYRAGDLRRLRSAMTFRHSADRAAARMHKVEVGAAAA